VIWSRLFVLSILVAVTGPPVALAQQVKRYQVPRTEHGHPDLQGVWATAFLTTLERPPGIDYLVATPEQALKMANTILTRRPAVLDPQFDWDGVAQLAMVKGEYRTSIIVEPRDGKMPFTQAGLDLVAKVNASNTHAFDHPEQRPRAERCLESLAAPPIRTVPVFLAHQILQTRDYVVMVSEDTPGPRIIRLRNDTRSDALRSLDGYAVAHWEGDTLVARTTLLKSDDIARLVLGRPLLLSSRSVITERFTRVSDSELVYQFTVEDPVLYTQPWTGEFSMTRDKGPIYEYACHEGNYSMPNILRGGQLESAATTTDRKP
jgi:hypothetical protein